MYVLILSLQKISVYKRKNTLRKNALWSVVCALRKLNKNFIIKNINEIFTTYFKLMEKVYFAFYLFLNIFQEINWMRMFIDWKCTFY